MKNKEIKYSEAIAELEAITAKMQSPECDIDSLGALTSRALELLKICKDKLFKTDEEVKKCLETLADSLTM
ncbi:MAG: exodeoxyribonuclease VII small subunit [Muribaculaceae bacterium]|nr:exodeoxyribonuclease VII small subunit [Muribaculaceae bacterium]